MTFSFYNPVSSNYRDYSQSSMPPVFIYTALACEAKPLIEHFGLKKITTLSVFPVYQQNTIHLTVTGLGKNAMSAAVAYTQALLNSGSNPVLLNVGVAGHAHQTVGNTYLVSQNTDHDSGKNYYPPIIFKPPCPDAHLLTFAKPHLSYQHDALYDMEGSAFFETATRFTSGELAQSLKVISDNRDYPAETLNAQQVSQLIARQIDTVAAVIDSVQSLVKSLALPADNTLYNDLIQRYHFTASEQTRLKQALLRWSLLTKGAMPQLPENCQRPGKMLLSLLEQELEKTEFNL